MTEIATEGFEVIPTFLKSTGIDKSSISNRQALADAWRDSGDGNWQPFIDLLDPDVIFHEAGCLPYGGSHHGRDEALRVFNDLLARFSYMSSETHEILTSGDYCVACLTMTFRVRHDSDAIPMQAAEVFKFRNGKIVDWRVHYFDASVVAAAFGA